MNHDEFYLTRAFLLARKGRFTTSPNPNVGCVIVRNGYIVGEGYHQCAGTEHAEVHALRQAKDDSRGATAYVTLEPCNHQGRTPSCTHALINAGVKEVISTIPDPNPQVAGSGFRRLQEAGVKVRYGLMQSEAEALNPGFLKRMRTGFPWIRLKLAASIDGRTAMESGASQWITSLESRQDVQCWRAESDAILSTAATVLADNPALTVRWASLPKSVKFLYPEKRLRQPLRVIIDTANRVKPFCRVIKEEGLTWLARIVPDDLTWSSSVKQLLFPTFHGTHIQSLDLISLMTYLGHYQINSLWVEAGPSLAGALLSLELIDELILYQAPKLLGSNARPLFFLSKPIDLSEAPAFTILDMKQLGPDIRFCLKPIKNS
ncbi:diaminohydroxyphosphoribosylaminopyrimidine deaminase [secondary endosymbiont of Heteropsylla cubana]|uniref:Riboflavin biosynthesis protein RibD n=1 Tax=secondary endosymbiont of Heteropsylla cubana TaxID=134287 RepID=J3VU87_9ENTR|nr:bifunctional diaminohydroxyphosphoribosylaminopyrimidine deaminase/5-amino-6-(5-phosphoribosylamino)uracil reductase RibD [secondary endosymbiont of Heteropsylla cubana]AFP85676.1 diaminohydroxyphosphoribosylaminopyrimidine deaminase [secondary endosymbiont of Heteropsylla cubana]